MRFTVRLGTRPACLVDHDEVTSEVRGRVYDACNGMMRGKRLAYITSRIIDMALDAPGTEISYQVIGDPFGIGANPNGSLSGIIYCTALPQSSQAINLLTLK